MSKTVDEYIIKNFHWQEELIFLRNLMLTTELQEGVKWGIPTYMIGGKNVVGLAAFKAYFGLWFFQGVFLKDKAKKLVSAQEGRTQGMRQWRFQTFDEMDEGLILTYVEEAIANQKAGKTIKPQKKELVIPPELQSELDNDGVLNQCFQSLTLTAKREFSRYILTAKKTETKNARLAKIKPMILNGTSIYEKYKN